MEPLTEAVYEELRRIAARHLSHERANHTLQPTALVHEAYLKLSDHSRQQFVDKTHFVATVSRAMRQVLVDYARARATHKRSGEGNAQAVPITSVEVHASEAGVDLVELIALDAALDAMAQEDERRARLVELRYFGGLTAEESAGMLDMSVHVVRHELRFAEAWLRRKMANAE